VAKRSKYLYGPVPSRRLGRSLGVDIVPFKTCTLDCIYCQLGKTTCKTLQRKEYVPVEDVLAELKQLIDSGLKADYITIGGSGEPTLHSGISRLISGIKKLTKIPVAVLTNGTLFYLPEVRADCAVADVILPSLDAGDQRTFEKVNRPHDKITFDLLVDGLCALKKEYKGRIWLEVFCIEDFNTDSGQLARLADAIKRIGPDKVHLNTAVRPTAEPDVEKMSADRLEEIARQLGPNCEVIADFVSSRCAKVWHGHPFDFAPRPTDCRGRQDRPGRVSTGWKPVPQITQTLLSMLKRRPCSLKDICSALGLDSGEAAGHLGELEKQGIIRSEKKQGRTFYTAR
jgi:wyosine [tRNA(Phe)-imidazoG37] synthetase (radical SAM superfamily)